MSAMPEIGKGFIILAVIALVAANSPLTSMIFGEGSAAATYISWAYGMFYVFLFIGILFAFFEQNPLYALAGAVVVTLVLLVIFNSGMVNL